MIQPILNSKKIKYAVMNTLIRGKIDQATEKVNIFIDLNSVITQLFSTRNVEEFTNINSAENRVILSSGLANIAAHYRHYFWSRHGLSTRIYFYYSDQKATRNLLVDSDYKKDYYSKRIEDNVTFQPIQNMIRTNYNICTTLFKYLIDVYFINTGDMECNLLPQHILTRDTGKEDLNIVLTTDVVQFQYVNFRNTFVINLAGDKSTLVDKFNLYTVAGYKDCKALSSSIYPIVLSLSKLPKYNLEGISGVGKVKAVKLILKAMEKNIIINTQYDNIDLLLEEMLDAKIFKNDSEVRLVKRNYDCINYTSLYNFVSIKQKEMIDKQITNLYNNKKLMLINDRFYHQEPLMLLELAEGVLTNV